MEENDTSYVDIICNQVAYFTKWFIKNREALEQVCIVLVYFRILAIVL